MYSCREICLNASMRYLGERKTETWQNVSTLVCRMTIKMSGREYTCMMSLLHYHKGNSWQITIFQSSACLKKAPLGL